MAIRLTKGGNTQINMEKFHVGLGWDVREMKKEDGRHLRNACHLFHISI